MRTRRFRALDRWFKDQLALGHENHIVMMPKHIWEPALEAAGGDTTKITDYDLEKGLPCGTGPYKIVSSST